MEILICITAFLVTFCFMECTAWFTHKYIMHGFLWVLHEDHHVPHSGFFEKNDFFFLIFAIPSCALFWLGARDHFDVKFFIGMGILAYGICYFLVHDVLIHRRFKWFDKTQNWYFKGLRKAHKIHHKKLGKHHGECFGMLFVPRKYFRENKK